MVNSCAGLTGESQAQSSGISYDDVCTTCNSTVNLADKVVKAGSVYHRACLAETAAGVDASGAVY